MTQTPFQLYRCTVVIRSITGCDAKTCARLVADHAGLFERALNEPSLGRTARRGCIDALAAHLDAHAGGTAAPLVNPEIAAALAMTERVAAETRHCPDALGRSARGVLDRYDAAASRPGANGPPLARQAGRG